MLGNFGRAAGIDHADVRSDDDVGSARIGERIVELQVSDGPAKISPCPNRFSLAARESVATEALRLALIGQPEHGDIILVGLRDRQAGADSGRVKESARAVHR
jgi:hypothetical protein